MSNAILSHISYLLGYSTGALAFWWLAQRRALNTVGVLCVLGAGLIGGLFFGNVIEWIATGHPGKTVIGAIGGGYLSIAVYKKVLGLERPLGDLFAFALSAGEAVGRWGCYFAGCCYGKPTSVPWAIWQHGAWRHPTQIYSSIAAAATFGLLLYLERKGNLPENGLFYIQGVLFCIFRFVIEFFRVDPIFAAGFTIAQIGCMAGLCFYGMKLVTMQYKTRMVVAQ